MLFIVQEETKVICSLKRLTNTKSKDYNEAIDIYSKNTSDLIKTNTNQIADWVIKAKNDKTRTMYVLGLYLNERIVGFCQFAHLKEKKVIFIDYLAIDKVHRSLGIFFQFIELIKNYIFQKKLDFSYIVTEVVFFSHTEEPCQESKGLIRLLKMVGFGTIECTYYQPQLEEENYESLMKSKLLILTNDEKQLANIKRETFLKLQNIIYFDHYYSWYIPYKSDGQMKKYKSSLIDLIKKSKINLKPLIDINYSNDTQYIKNTQLPFTFPNIKFIIYIVSFLLIIATFVVVIKLTDFSGIPLVLIFAFSLFIVFCFISLIDKTARNILIMITDIIKKIFDKS